MNARSRPALSELAPLVRATDAPGVFGGNYVAFAGAEAPMPALAGLAAAAAHMTRQIIQLDIDDPEQCLRLFRSNNAIGWMIFLGLLGGAVWVVAKPLV